MLVYGPILNELVIAKDMDRLKEKINNVLANEVGIKIRNWNIKFLKDLDSSFEFTKEIPPYKVVIDGYWSWDRTVIYAGVIVFAPRFPLY